MTGTPCTSENKIYFIRPIERVGPIKIGCSKFIGRRLDEMCKWSPVPLEVVAVGAGDFALERHLHKMFADHRLHKEWFSPAPALLEAIDRVKAGQSILEAFEIERRKRTPSPRKEAV